MSMSLLGERFDIHTGGADNVFPHHEAELAQSEGVTGHRVVSLWMHGGLLLLAGARMAKYRTKLNFSTEGLAGADRALAHLRARLADWVARADAPAGEHDEFEARF